jgi:hypothetical protein
MTDRRQLPSLVDQLWAAAKRTGLSKRISLYDLSEMAKALKEVAPPGRTILDMPDEEYERMRDALGPEWEWDELVMRSGTRTGEGSSRQRKPIHD